MKDISCKVIEDLIPLVEDGIASDESRILVEEHIKDCQSCLSLLENRDLSGKERLEPEDKKIIKSIKKSIYRLQTIILVLGTIIGVALTNTMGMFYNIALIPLLGATSYILLRGKWYMGPLGIVVLTYLWEIVQSLILGYFTWQILYGGLIMPAIYGGLAFLGVVIGFLLNYSFGKGDVGYEK